jgi:DNA-binding transcriptional LysR family regulator
MELRQMEWSDLRIFLAIARTGTLGAAARAIGQSQPTMGRRLSALEAAVGHKLFQRTAQGLVATDEGSAMREHAERMEAEALGLERRLTERIDLLSGELRITSSEWFGGTVLTPVLHEFSELYPNVTIELLTDSRFLSLARREADIAFRIRPFVERDVVARKLMHVSYGAYVRRGDAQHVSPDGAGVRLITLEAGFAGSPDDSWLQNRLPQAHVGFRSNSRAAQARLCELGLGVAVLPVLFAQSLPGIERIDLGARPPGRDTWVGYHQDLRQLARLRAFMALLSARLS